MIMPETAITECKVRKLRTLDGGHFFIGFVKRCKSGPIFMDYSTTKTLLQFAEITRGIGWEYDEFGHFFRVEYGPCTSRIYPRYTIRTLDKTTFSAYAVGDIVEWASNQPY